MRFLSLPALLCLIATPALAQNVKIPAGLTGNSVGQTRAVNELANAIVREDAKLASDPAFLFRSQLLAGTYQAALANLERLRTPLADNPSARVAARYLEYVTYATALLEARDKKIPFETAYRRAFAAVVEPLANRLAAIVVNGLSFDNLSQAQQALQHDLTQLKGKHVITIASAAELVRDYSDREMYRAFAATSLALIDADDARRYLIQKDLPLPVEGATVCVMTVRPKNSVRLPTLLQFTIYNDAGSLLREARRAASNGYVGAIGLTRGKGCSPDPIVPYEHDGADAAALIDWIASQAWSDGQVGMFGGSYSGFTPWATAKYRPKALKAIMVGAPNAPGIDAPMEGNVFWNFMYPWPFYTTNNKTLDNATYNDRARWQSLDHNWYAGGRAYRDLDKIEGTPNPVFDRWISHQSYDGYWQKLIPYQEDFAGIDIPVLETAGYYFGGPGAAVYYLSQHYKYRPDAHHYLIIGPYDHLMGQRGTATPYGDTEILAGYKLDPSALIDLTELRFRWFDYALKGKAKPAILADKINYQVTGANIWKHAPSIAAMATGNARYYLSSENSAQAHLLVATPPAGGSIRQTVDFANRDDVDAQSLGGDVQDANLDTTNGLAFVSEPLAKSLEMSGLFSGSLDFIANKKDFDFQVSLFELTAEQQYIQLAPFWSRASYVGDLTMRQLLTPELRQTFDFRSMRLMSRKIKAGSRLVVVLNILKEPARQINYGTGGSVIDETVADAKVPLQITWFPSSYIDFPVSAN
jgi:putative CocE/NonD family hydrolase